MINVDGIEMWIEGSTSTAPEAKESHIIMMVDGLELKIPLTNKESPPTYPNHTTNLITPHQSSQQQKQPYGTRFFKQEVDGMELTFSHSEIRQREEEEPYQPEVVILGRLRKELREPLRQLPEIAFASMGVRNKRYYLENQERLSVDDRKKLGLILSRHRWLVNEEKLDFNSVKDRLEILRFQAIGINTFSTYCSHWRQLKARGLPINGRGLTEILAFDKFGEVSNASYQTWLDSVNFYLQAKSLEPMPPMEERAIKRMMDGICYLQPDRSIKDTGSIGYDQICEMMAVSSVPMAVCEGLALMHATGCRGSQVCNMRHLMFRPIYAPKEKDGDEDEILFYCYSTQRQKIKPRRKTAENSIENHYTDPSWNDLLEELILRADERMPQISNKSPMEQSCGLFMIPGFRGSGENEHVKKAAKELGWEECLNWRLHSCRYGAAADAALAAAERGASAQEILNEIKKRTAHLSASMAQKYSEARDPKIRRSEARMKIRQIMEGCEDKGIPFDKFIRYGKKSVVLKDIEL